MNNELNDNQLEKILENLAKEGKPDQKFQKALLKEVKSKYKKIYGHSSWIMKIFRFKLQLASSLALLTLTSTTLYAYNSNSIVTGDLLYPLKRSVETVEGYFADNEEEKSNYYSKMAERRTRELEHIEIESESYKNTIRETERMVEMAKTELNKVEKRRLPEIKIEIDRTPENTENNEEKINKTPIEKKTIRKLPETVNIENNNKIEFDSNSADNFKDINETSSKSIELKPEFGKLEESISIPITPEGKINITEQVETKADADDETTILRSRIQKVESDIKRLKEEPPKNFRTDSKVKTGR